MIDAPIVATFEPMPADSREQARTLGVRYYRDARPCPNGHADPVRYVRTGACRDCVEAIGREHVKPKPAPDETVAVRVPLRDPSDLPAYRAIAEALVAARNPGRAPVLDARVVGESWSVILHRDDADVFRALAC